MLSRRAVAPLLVLTLIVNSVQPASACIWDSDTLAAEAKGLPEVVAIIVGRFDRQPPKYYEMRLERVTKLLAEDPSNLEAYDDAGASCDRLGRGDEAIAWMERKKSVLDQADADDPEIEQHRYRYLANVGTFWVHRWFKNGADREQLDEVRTARDFIAQAIELNPEAHFGREKYQLLALDLILREPPAPTAGEEPRWFRMPSLLDVDGERFEALDRLTNEGALEKAGIPDAVRGLTGLIAMGNAWESVDVYYALAQALQAEGRSSLAHLASARMNELITAGRGSVVAGAPRKFALIEWADLRHPLEDRSVEMLDAFYHKARQSADEWHTRRTEYMEQQLDAGRHPDTHPDFWKSWNDKPALPALPAIAGRPDLDDIARRGAFMARLALAVGALAAIGLGLAIVGVLAFRRTTSSPKAN